VGVHLFAVRTEPPILAVVPRQKFWTQNLHGVIGAPVVLGPVCDIIDYSIVCSDDIWSKTAVST